MTARTCVGGHWPIAEYGPICPSCVEDLRDAITAEAFDLRRRGLLAPSGQGPEDGFNASIVATRMMVAVEKVLRP